MTLSTGEIKSLRDRLMEVGPAEFLEEVINRDKMEPRHVGIVFNLDPRLEVEDTSFLKLLACTISRAFWKRKKIRKSRDVRLVKLFTDHIRSGVQQH